MNDFDKIKDAAEFMINSQGYADVMMVARMSGIPGMIVENVFKQLNYIKTPNEGQYVK
jgi:hypothetical protein